jgi:hypothetical protein
MHVSASTISLTVADVDASHDFFLTHLGPEPSISCEQVWTVAVGALEVTCDL